MDRADTATDVGPDRVAERHRWPLGAVVSACVGLAVATLAVPAALSFDPWAWLVWGREIVDLDLDTTGGPSWKPLPVLVTTVVAPLGSLAVPLYTVLARAGCLLALAATHRLASRLAGPVAGVVAAALLVLTPDGDPRFLRLVGEAHVAPVAVAFGLLAVESHLDGRRSRALALGWGAALLRPEAWPFLGCYGLWLWWRERRTRPLVAVLLASIPVLWFGGDWWGAGDPLHGADAAQVGTGIAAGERLVDALAVAAGVVPAPAWVAAAFALVTTRRRAERLPLALAGGALAWAVLVVAMATALGYAALSRFFLPAAGVACVLAGVGTARAATEVRRRWPEPGIVAAAVLGVVVGLTLLAPRVAGLDAVVDEMVDRGRLEDDLDRVIQLAGGRERLASCGEVVVAGNGLLRTSVAWKLELPLHRVPLQLADGSGTLLLPADGRRARNLEPMPGIEVVARTDRWVSLAARCPSAAVPDS